MARSDWSKIPDFGHPLIDAQHRKIVASTKRILNLLRQPAGRAELVPSLIDYAALLAEHFSAEEALMEHICSEKHAKHTETHKRTHFEITNMINNLILEVKDKGVDPYIKSAFNETFKLFLKNVTAHDAILTAIIQLENML